MNALEYFKATHFSEQEVADILKIKVATLRNRHSKGLDHPPRTPEGWYPKDEFEKWNRSRLKYEIGAKAS